MRPYLGQGRLYSPERSTGMGASHSARILCEDGSWVRVSAFPGSVHEGREAGYSIYSLPIEADWHWGYFYRSNSGREEVSIYRGVDPTPVEVLGSFQRAEIWGGEHKPMPLPVGS